MAKKRMTKPPAAITKDQATIAIEVGSVIARREDLTSSQRAWLVKHLHGLASDALEHRPTNRKALNSDRDVFMAMDYILNNQAPNKEAQKIVARRWKVSPHALGQVVRRMRGEVVKLIARSKGGRDALLLVVKTHRDRSVGTSVTRPLRKTPS